MESNTRTDEDDAEPMLPEQFQIAVERTQIRSEELIAACKAVLVDSKTQQDVAQQLNVDRGHISRAVNKIREKWQEICKDQRWEYLPIALPHSTMQLVLKMQHDELEKYRAGGRRKPRRK